MIRNVFDYYSHLFQEENEITAAYFITNTGTEYRIYFYPAGDYFDYIDMESLLYKDGYYFGFTKLTPNEEKIEPIDCKIRNTILNVIGEFFDEKGSEKVLIFHCDNGDGKKHKRALSFDNWYRLSDTKNRFRKYDEELVINTLDDTNNLQTVIEYLSIIIECSNPKEEEILKEFQFIKETLIGDK